jgi:hypothetical protein
VDPFIVSNVDEPDAGGCTPTIKVKEQTQTIAGIGHNYKCSNFDKKKDCNVDEGEEKCDNQI